MEASLIIPTYNRPNRLARCLASLVQQDFTSFEVIIVDDEGETPLEEVVAPFRSQFHLTLLRVPHGGPAKARNAGARQAVSKVLLFTDDDCEADPSWIRLLVTKVHEAPGVMAGGKVLNRLSNNPYSAAAQSIVDIVYAHYNSVPGKARFFASNNIAMAAETFHRMNGFDETYPLAAAEDRDLCERWYSAGLPLLYVPEAIIHHSHPMTLRRFCRVHFNYGRGAAMFHRRNDHRDIGMHTSAWEWLSAPFREMPFLSAVHRMLLLGAWQLSNLAGFLYERTREATGS
ncbi:glycosyltransferase family 2 protein [Bryobacter aggregatus]|uniref:glycosyltransferase family 2 protein n=1 Tax=Bryobacter aggregatus TaxID=360054 RepID=UPI00138E2118|nr:glycosyltransferase [Bryobacter aggregatus]